nr:immunoglobulin heavy chain junction region [Mus musculus]
CARGKNYYGYDAWFAYW